MKALILSAGSGTRLLPYSAQTPKPMFTLAGRPLLDLHIRKLEALGCDAVAVNTHHLSETIREFIEAQPYSIPVHIRHEPQLLGTGGAIKNLTDFWGHRPFIVINADIHHEFDLAPIYEFHCGHSHPVTLVLWDDATFNSVRVDRHRRVRAFEAHPPESLQGQDALWTFTGIQVLDPLVLDFLPAGRPSHSIDAYRAMMTAGHTIKAYLPEKGSWTDLGTPPRYRAMARKMAARAGFAAAFGNPEPAEIALEPIAGDGSERHWFRLRSGEHTLILCDHGLREHHATAEVDAFVSIGDHLKKLALPVPQIYFHDRFAGLVVIEDLGDCHLQTAVRQAADKDQILIWYRQIIADLIDLSQDGIRGFEPAWAYQSENYDRDLILEKECRYFVDAFLEGYLGITADFERLRPEFEYLAVNALKHAHFGFMHRDLQSRNIMVADERFYLIDFQAGRKGPLQYDLASLLIDPYVDLPEPLQDDLLDYAIARLARRGAVNPENFRHSYRYCALSRNLQVLGAFGFLLRVRGKDHFKAYIGPAVKSLERQLAHMGGSEFKTLRQILENQILPRFK